MTCKETVDMGFRKLNPRYKPGEITTLEQLYHVEHQEQISDRSKFDVYAALSWLEYSLAKIPQSCSLQTKRSLQKAVVEGLVLCHDVIIEELIERMHFADTHREFASSCGTKALWYLYRDFCDKVGSQRVEFIPYVEAAAAAAMKSVWHTKFTSRLVSTHGSRWSRFIQLMKFAHDLGFAIESANDAEGNAAIILIDVKLKSRKSQKVTAT